MIDLSFKYKHLLEFIKKESPFTPDISIILGSGLGDFANNLKIHKSISTTDIPDYPESTVAGHKGKIHFAEYQSKKLILFQGRIHFYEGYNLNECILPVLISYKSGVKYLLLTNAAGGINKKFVPGDLMLASSLNGIMIKKELTDLIGLSDEKGKNNFLSMPNPDFNETIKSAAKFENINLKEGIYWYTKGPTYETPSEIKFFAKYGADAVGMSTVHEAVYASYLGIKTSAISCITNYAAGISDQKLSHTEVTETADRVKDTFARLVLSVIGSL